MHSLTYISQRRCLFILFTPLCSPSACQCYLMHGKTLRKGPPYHSSRFRNTDRCCERFPNMQRKLHIFIINSGVLLTAWPSDHSLLVVLLGTTVLGKCCRTAVSKAVEIFCAAGSFRACLQVHTARSLTCEMFRRQRNSCNFTHANTIRFVTMAVPRPPVGNKKEQGPTTTSVDLRMSGRKAAGNTEANSCWAR